MFIAFNETTLGAFQELGDTLTDNVRTGLEQFVMKLYCGEKSFTASALADLRWHIFSKYQYESEKIPFNQIHVGTESIKSTLHFPYLEIISHILTYLAKSRRIWMEMERF